MYSCMSQYSTVMMTPAHSMLYLDKAVYSCQPALRVVCADPGILAYTHAGGFSSDTAGVIA